ncbi:hypothetical protein BD410DRAFT_853351, partial [Rickenella mellea]
PLRCSACKAIKYCSKSCQKDAWNTKLVEGGTVQKGHRYHCAGLKVESTEVMAVFLQFPWAKLEPEGYFLLWFALATRDLFGTGGNGWWAQGIGRRTYSFHEIGNAGQKLLLDEHHLSDHSRWSLPRDEVPFLLSPNKKSLEYPPNFEHNWKSYYEWRGLPLSSPASLLLHWPLSVYRLLFLMGLVPQTIPVSRGRLVLYYIGVQQELDCIPIFGELAVLLPNTDVELILFGQRAYQLTTLAKPPSLASGDYVFTYTAPPEYGSGTLRIRLDKTGPFWDPTTLLSDRPYPYPDALIGLNAGISCHEQWRPVLSISRTLKIPFGVTDFNRQCLADDEGNTVPMVHSAASDIRTQHRSGCYKARVMLEALHRPFEKALNPFMKPGAMKDPTSYLPSGINGFTSVITPRLTGQAIWGCSWYVR